MAENTNRVMSKHSPGPWKAVPLGEGPRGKPLGISINGPLPLFILPGTTDQQKANARLIAAAPDMLEALKWFRDNAPALEHLRHEAISERANAAIAKAEGE